MKQIFIYVPTLFIMLAFSVACGDDALQYTIDNSEEDFVEVLPSEVSIDEAQKDLELLLSDLYRSGLSKSGISKRLIGERFTIEPCMGLSKSSGGPNIPLHVFNFENEEGFAIMSGDRGTESLLCLSEDGNFHPSDSIDNPGFSMFMETLMSQVAPLHKPYTPASEDGGKYKKAPLVAYGNYKNELVTPQFGLCKTSWGQEAPYNNLCFFEKKIDSVTTQTTKALVGCVAVAVGQLMAAYQYPFGYQSCTFHWDQMIQGCEMGTVSMLLKHLGDKNNLDMHYSDSLSYSYSSYVTRTFKNFGYSCPGELKPFSEAAVIEELNHGYPLYMSGASVKVDSVYTFYEGGHAWVVHGYLKRTRPVIEYENVYPELRDNKVLRRYQETSYYFLMNWGWNGHCDGYYLSGCYDVRNGKKPDFDKSISKTVRREGSSYIYRYNFNIVTGVRK